jgi:hypothetical protein
VNAFQVKFYSAYLFLWPQAVYELFLFSRRLVLEIYIMLFHLFSVYNYEANRCRNLEPDIFVGLQFQFNSIAYKIRT